MSYFPPSSSLSFFAFNSINTLFDQNNVLLQYDTSFDIEVSGANDTVLDQPAKSFLVIDSRAESNWGTDPRFISTLGATAAACTNTRSVENSGTAGMGIDYAVTTGLAYSLNRTNATVSNSVRQYATTPALDFEPYASYSRVVGWRVK